MLSILIPVYNYDVSKLIFEIHKQALLENIVFEIIYLEDGSDNFVEENKSSIKNLEYCKTIISTPNKGRTKSRQILADNAAYDWLLFLDADVFPKSSAFIKNYITLLNSGFEVIYGGFAYKKTKPKPKHLLRWKYGSNYEQLDAEKRNLKPYKIVISANVLIEKNIFCSINSRIERRSYGLDNYFGAILKSENIKVNHINNEVFHYGLDTNGDYLIKTKDAISELLCLYHNNKDFAHENSLLNMFSALKKYRLNYFFALNFKLFNSIIEKNLIGNNPKMTLLQAYKILYMCHKDLKLAEK